MIQSHINCHQILQACKFILFVDCFYLFKEWFLLFYAMSLVYYIMQKSCRQQLKWDSSLFCFSHGFSQLSVSGYFECYETSISNTIQLPYGDILIACFEKSLALGTWAVIHFPSHSETFLLILLASQPCKIPCFNSLFMIYYSISSLAVQWCLVTTLWCSKHILQPFSVLSNPLIGNFWSFEIAFAFFMYYSILLVIAGISLSTTFLEIFLVP